MARFLFDFFIKNYNAEAKKVNERKNGKFQF